MSNLKELIEEIKLLKTETAVELDDTDLRTYNVKLGLLRQAKQKLEDLKQQYKVAVSNRVAYILAVGSESGELVKRSVKDFGVIEYDANTMVDDLIKDIPEEFYVGKTMSSAILDMVTNHLYTKVEDIKIENMPTALYYEARYNNTINSKEDLARDVKMILNEQVGKELMAFDAVHKASVKALEEEFSGKIVPVMINATEENIADIGRSLSSTTKNVFVVSSGEVSDKIKESSLAYLEKLTKKEIENALVSVQKNFQ